MSEPWEVCPVMTARTQYQVTLLGRVFVFWCHSLQQEATRNHRLQDLHHFLVAGATAVARPMEDLLDLSDELKAWWLLQPHFCEACAGGWKIQNSALPGP